MDRFIVIAIGWIGILGFVIFGVIAAAIFILDVLYWLKNGVWNITITNAELVQRFTGQYPDAGTGWVIIDNYLFNYSGAYGLMLIALVFFFVFCFTEFIKD